MNLFLIHTSYSTVQSAIWQMHGVCCCTRKKFIQVAKKRHFDLCNFRHFVPDWCNYSNQPKVTLFYLFWRCWQNWKGGTMTILIHLIYFDVLFIGHFFNLKFWTNLQTFTYVMYKFFWNLHSWYFCHDKMLKKHVLAPQ